MSIYVYGEICFHAEAENLLHIANDNFISNYELVDKNTLKYQIQEVEDIDVNIWFLGENCFYGCGGLLYTNEKSLQERMKSVQNKFEKLFLNPNVDSILFCLDSGNEFDEIAAISISDFASRLVNLYLEWDNFTPSVRMCIIR